MPIGILLTIGKYLFVTLLYLFVALVFRALMRPAAGQRQPAATRVRRERREVSAPTSQPTGLPVALREDSEPARPMPAQEPEPAPQPPPAVLVVQRWAEATVPSGHVYPLSTTTTIGRGSHNAIVLPERYVSKDHAIIYLQNDRYLLCDQHATNGTYHNGIRIAEPVALADGDEITIGTTVFTYQAEG